ncbi:HAD superfamily hydrolase (TIGR01509 family) [Crossiella equi]|uniref:HAD superfamily hydrolase (TIGR01509 family) n=1 Tax=Crossiella equi TaxID=130796 RepID=A0ABS5AQV5_9PSEU|nr:HAD-IA family hydrolase [Crossiella equi]MBP2478622.1 HAD superfamily hydrolase (TIGR01509 family) [Crossiella equi]
MKAIVFDHDGTLVDTVTSDMLACEALFTARGAVFPRTMWAREVCGQPESYPTLFELVRTRTGTAVTDVELWAELRANWAQFMTVDHIRLLPGAVELLTGLSALGLPMAVASAADRSWVEHWLTHFGLRGFFTAVVAGDEVADRKPDPAVYLAAAAKLGVAPQDCVVVEDSLTGVTAARRAGARVYVVPTVHTRHLDHSAADGVLSSLADFPLPDRVGTT